MELTYGCDCSGCLCGDTPAPTTTPAPTSFACNINFGGTNDGYATEYLGLYEHQDFDTNGAPYYRHESGSYYMYLDDTGLYWYAGPVLGAGTGSWYGAHVTNSPTDVVTWKVRDGGEWVEQPGMAVESATNDSVYPALCWMEETPAPTTTPTSFACNINFGRTNDGFHTEYLGLYEHQGFDANSAPYYKHESGSYYMYLRDDSERWLVGSVLGDQSMTYVWWLGYAITSSPTDAVTWKVWDGDDWAEQSGVIAESVANGGVYPGLCSMAETPAPTTIPTAAPSSFACNINFGGTSDGYYTEYLGLYEHQGFDNNRAPYYRHESGSYHMYLLDDGEWWFVGDVMGDQSAADAWWLGVAITKSPADVATWQVYGEDGFMEQPEVTVEGVASGDTYSPECWAYTPRAASVQCINLEGGGGRAGTRPLRLQPHRWRLRSGSVGPSCGGGHDQGGPIHSGGFYELQWPGRAQWQPRTPRAGSGGRWCKRACGWGSSTGRVACGERFC